MEEIERLLAESEEDAIAASDEAMRLKFEFGNDPLLLGFVAEANQTRTIARRLNARLQQLKQGASSPTRNVKIQLLSSQAVTLRSDAGKLKATVFEVGRND